MQFFTPYSGRNTYSECVHPKTNRKLNIWINEFFFHFGLLKLISLYICVAQKSRWLQYFRSASKDAHTHSDHFQRCNCSFISLSSTHTPLPQHISHFNYKFKQIIVFFNIDCCVIPSLIHLTMTTTNYNNNKQKKKWKVKQKWKKTKKKTISGARFCAMHFDRFLFEGQL